MPEVLLINSPLYYEQQKCVKVNEDSLPPLGLGYIASDLEKNSIEVELIDAVFENLSVNQIYEQIINKSPKYVGINIFSTNYPIVKRLVEGYKYEVNFIIGGVVTKYLYDQIIDWQTDNHITVIIGEGDYIVTDIVKGKVVSPPIFNYMNRTVYEVDIKSFYFPNCIDSLPLIKRKLFKNEPILNHYGFYEANILTSRGCIHNCAFCGAARKMNPNNSIRERSINNIIGELTSLKVECLSLTSIRILDDLFLKNSDSVANAANLFKSVGLYWRAMAHIQSFRNVTYEAIQSLKNSGCFELSIGIESGSTSILKMIHKTRDISIIKKTLCKILSTGINVKGYFIYGFPGETEQDFADTYALAEEVMEKASILDGNFRVSVFEFRPYHGTELFEFIKKNYTIIEEIKPNWNLSDQIGRNQFNFRSENFSNCSDEVLNKYIIMTNKLNESR